MIKVSLELQIVSRGEFMIACSINGTALEDNEETILLPLLFRSFKSMLDETLIS